MGVEVAALVVKAQGCEDNCPRGGGGGGGDMHGTLLGWASLL